jgi:aldehyde dehydrogenase (NAD+)
LLTVLPDSIQAVQEAVASGVDKVVLTGSVPTGKAIQRLLADKLVPSTMELSGCDAMFVTDSANVQLAANCLRLGLRMNGSQTCIAPRRVFVNKCVEQRFRDELLRQLNYAKGNGTAQTVPSPPQQPHEDSINHDSGARVRGDESDRPDKPSPERSSDPPGGRVSDGLVQAALASGAVVLSETPKVLSKVTPNMEITQSDIFEPVTSLIAYDTIDEAVAMNDECPYALGATVFGSDSKTTGEFTRRINAGCIVVNDMIVPTADPRVPFGGRKQSGFGVTRGTAGLEEMTQLKAIVTQRSSWLPHLDEPTPLDEDVMARLIQTLHTPNLFGRMRNSLRLAKAAMAQRKHRNKRQHR